MLTRRQLLISAATVLAAATGYSALKPQLPATLAIPPVQEEGPRPLLRVALLSDPHTVAADSDLAGAMNGKLGDAVADYKPLRPDLWLVNGDLTDRGKSEELEAFKQVMAKVCKPEQMLVTTGNHDFYDAEATDAEELRRFMAAFGLKTPYSNRVAGGIHIVMLADEQYKTAPGSPEWAWLSPEQLNWFEAVLLQHRDLFTVVSLHQPLQDTVIWSHGSNSFAGCGQIDQVRAILGRNPQVKLWLSGHTHFGAEMKGSVAHIGGVAYVGLGSTFYHFVESTRPEDQGGWPTYGGFVKDLGACQSRLMEVWPDKVVLRARDHVKKAWLDAHELVLTRG